MIDWWLSLPVYQADAFVIIGGCAALGLYGAVMHWLETRAK